MKINRHGHPQGSVSFALGPNAVQRPKPVKARSNARIVTAIETGSGADDKFASILLSL